MAIIHRAELAPSKLTLIRAWLPNQPWSTAGDAELRHVGAYRFDDPAGEVGIETHLVEAEGGDLFHVPLTYRAEPLDGAEAALLGTMEHSVLGTRFTYDACADPVYVSTLTTAILSGGAEAPEFVETDDGPLERPRSTRVRGSGSIGTASAIDSIASTTRDGWTLIQTGAHELAVARVVDSAVTTGPGGAETLTGTWTGVEVPALLATARPR